MWAVYMVFYMPMLMLYSVFLLLSFAVMLNFTPSGWGVMLEQIFIREYTAGTRRMHLPKHEIPQQFTPSICFMGGKPWVYIAALSVAEMYPLFIIQYRDWLLCLPYSRGAAMDVCNWRWSLHIRELRHQENQIPRFIQRMLRSSAFGLRTGPLWVVQVRLGKVYGTLRLQMAGVPLWHQTFLLQFMEWLPPPWCSYTVLRAFICLRHYVSFPTK